MIVERHAGISNGLLAHGGHVVNGGMSGVLACITICATSLTVLHVLISLCCTAGSAFPEMLAHGAATATTVVAQRA